jgi:ABC-type antimicrobial peptide transport system permease subunit
MALGALQRQLVLLVLRDGARPLFAGLMLGILSALALGKLIAGLLYRVSPYDTLTLAVTVAALVLSGALTLWLPARRAAKIDPMIALRAE